MIPTRLTFSAATLLLLSAVSARAEPAYVTSTVNLRSGAGTTNEIIAKIPGGSQVDATNCSEWCEIEWQGKRGFAIATSLDRSGRAPAPRAATRRPAPVPPPPATAYIDDDIVPVPPPAVYGVPAPYYYGYSYAYRPYYYGYRRYGYGYRRAYRRW